MEQKAVSNVPEPGDGPILHEPDAVFISDGPGTGSGSGVGVRPERGCTMGMVDTCCQSVSLLDSLISR